MSQRAASQNLMLLSGGTGGHVFPALALANELILQGHHVSFMTDRRGVKYLKELDPQVTLCVLPLGSKPTSLLSQPIFLLTLFFCCVKALQFILKQKPSKIIGYGGYPALPGLLIGILLRKELYASEQDAVLGEVNKLFARFFHKIFLATPLLRPLPPALAQKCHLVGLPLRDNIARLQDRLYQAPEAYGPVHLAIIGGSQGAAVFSEVVPQALLRLPKDLQQRLQVTHQCRPDDVDRVRAIYESAGLTAIVSDFFTTMDKILAKTHVLISRSGASTLAEVIAVGLPTIFVPYPYATHDHQTANARLLVDQGAGWLLTQQELSVEKCFSIVKDLLNHPQKLLFASERLRVFAQKNVTRTLASKILNV